MHEHDVISVTKKMTAGGRRSIAMVCLLVSLAVLSVLPGAFSAAIDHNTFCEGLALAGNCSFYSLCMEKRVPCGPDGYALGYAGKYCVKFTENLNEFTKDVRRELFVIRMHTCSAVR